MILSAISAPTGRKREEAVAGKARAGWARDKISGGTVVKTLCSQCREPRFDPRSGNEMPHAPTKSLYA